jgi:hypothetical protein
MPRHLDPADEILDSSPLDLDAELDGLLQRACDRDEAALEALDVELRSYLVQEAELYLRPRGAMDVAAAMLESIRMGHLVARRHPGATLAAVLRLTRARARAQAERPDPFSQVVMGACAGSPESLRLVQVDCEQELAEIEREHCGAYFFWRPGTVLERFWRAMRQRRLTVPRRMGVLEWLQTAFTKMVLVHVEELKRLPTLASVS